MTDSKTNFYARLATILNSNQSRSVILSGNVYDLFRLDDSYLPLIPYLCDKSQIDGILRIVYELNGPIRILDERDKLKNAWIAWKAGLDLDTLLLKGLRERGQTDVDRLGNEFDRHLIDAIGKPSLALEFMRQLTVCSRSSRLAANLMIFIEAADMLLPSGGKDIGSLNDKQLRRISICQDWFGDPAFMNGGDSVCLIAESRSLVHPRVARLPQVLNVEILAPDVDDRRAFIEHFIDNSDRKPKLWSSSDDLAALTAGLSLHAVRQVLAAAAYVEIEITPSTLIDKVEEFIQAQVGDDVVEFKKPSHRLEDVVGNATLKKFLKRELLPRFRTTPDKALPGAAVAGPIGGGKTYIFEAVAGELGLPVLVLKSIRSQWFGQTDVVFERLRRVLQALDKVVIFVDEADTQFGGVGAEAHSTERRLTGKIQAMMSDPQLRGKIMWLLMTARIHLLSPDIRRPGRVGDLIIPVLDPQGDIEKADWNQSDRKAFLDWMLDSILLKPTDDDIRRLNELTLNYSAAAFASLRSQLKASDVESVDEIVEIASDHIPPNIGLTRRYQTLQAIVNCTRRSLLPKPDFTDKDRQAWQAEIRTLEQMGVQ